MTGQELLRKFVQAYKDIPTQNICDANSIDYNNVLDRALLGWHLSSELYNKAVKEVNSKNEYITLLWNEPLSSFGSYIFDDETNPDYTAGNKAIVYFNENNIELTANPYEPSTIHMRKGSELAIMIANDDKIKMRDIHIVNDGAYVDSRVSGDVSKSEHVIVASGYLSKFIDKYYRGDKTYSWYVAFKPNALSSNVIS